MKTFNYPSTIILIILLTTIKVQATTLAPAPNPTHSPSIIIVNLGQNEINLGKAGTGVFFDFYGNGQAIYTQWTAPFSDQAFLIIDKNGNGLVDDGSEMFSNINMLILDKEIAPDGFANLAQYDRIGLGGNDDGFITPEDQIWPQLKLWLDNNADGISTPNEILSPNDFDIHHFHIMPRVKNHQDAKGNKHPFWSWAKPSSDSNHQFIMAEVMFNTVKP